METTTSIEAAPRGISRAPERASRLRAPVSDERLVRRIRAGNDAAFTTLYERYHRPLLSFCRHMLGSQAEAEDAVQQSFVNAYRDITRGEKDLRMRPWLYKIARNQCLSMLRGRRPEAELDPDRASLRGLSEEIAHRTELRDLLRDLGRLPPEQREALVLAELNDNSHAEVAEILGCDREKVKSLVFQARSSLIKSRDARSLACEDVQRQLSVLSGGSLRRAALRRHLDDCPICRAFRADVKSQRAAFALVLPVAPSASWKLGAGSALAAAKAAGGAGAVVSSGAAGGAGVLGAKLWVSGSVVKSAAAALAVSAAVGGAAGVEVARHRAPHPAPAANPAHAAERPQTLSPTGDPARRGASVRDPAASRIHRRAPGTHGAPANGGAGRRLGTRKARGSPLGGSRDVTRQHGPVLRPDGRAPQRRSGSGRGRLQRPGTASPDRTQRAPKGAPDGARNRGSEGKTLERGGESSLPSG
jgi:RNA polymerase sigma factor (sigma-70 family)